VTDAFRLLSDDEVRQIALIIENLDRSTFDFLQLEFGDIKLTIGKGPPPPAVAASQQVSVAPPVTVPQAASAVSIPPPVAPVVPLSADLGNDSKKMAGRVDSMDIVAPLLGRFYSQSEPGAPSFVSVGSEVTEDTTVGLIEVMKTFSAVRAGIGGVVTEICVQDTQLVEYGDVLFRVRPHKAA
jgi:acetyl-CoA carboxylase biotin carboxyl carrier protein